MIASYTRELAAKWTEEKWEITQCQMLSELKDIVCNQKKTDIACVDITIEGALELVKELRKNSMQVYIILIANTKMSPLTYMRPSVGAESLMLKPLSEKQIQTVMEEAVRAYTERFYHADEEKLFVLENKNGRELIPYEQICFFESREKKIYLNTEMEEYGFAGTLDVLEEQLQRSFLRCHRSFLVNRKKISRIHLAQNCLCLESGFEIPVSRTCKTAVKEYLKENRL